MGRGEDGNGQEELTIKVPGAKGIEGRHLGDR